MAIGKVGWLGIGTFGALILLGMCSAPDTSSSRTVVEQTRQLDRRPVAAEPTPEGFADQEPQLEPFTGSLDPVVPLGQAVSQSRLQDDLYWQERAAAREMEYQLSKQAKELSRIAAAEEDQALTARRALEDARYAGAYYSQRRSSSYEEDAPLYGSQPPQQPITYRSYDGRNMDRAIDVGNWFVKDLNTGVVRPTIDMGNGVRQEVRRPIDAYNDVGRALNSD